MPHKCFLNAAEQHQPDLVLVSCVASEGLECSLDLIGSLRDRRTPRNHYIIGAGGHCVSANEKKFIDAGADFTCSTLRQFAKNILPEIETHGKQAFKQQERPSE